MNVPKPFTNLLVSAIVLACVLLPGCAGYRLGSMLPPDIKLVHVPTFINKTSEPQLEIATTRFALQEFQTDGSLKLSSAEEAASYEDAGLWENCHELVPVGVSFADVQAFQASMAADAASALNWDPARQLYFLIYAYGEAEDASEDMAVIAQARNAPAAAWAWRYHARDIKSVKQPIRVEGLCPIMGAPKPANESKE